MLHFAFSFICVGLLFQRKRKANSFTCITLSLFIIFWYFFCVKIVKIFSRNVIIMLVKRVLKQGRRKAFFKGGGGGSF